MAMMHFTESHKTQARRHKRLERHTLIAWICSQSAFYMERHNESHGVGGATVCAASISGIWWMDKQVAVSILAQRLHQIGQ